MRSEPSQAELARRLAARYQYPDDVAAFGVEEARRRYEARLRGEEVPD